VITLGAVAVAVIAVAAAYALMHLASAQPGPAGHKPGRGTGTVAALKIISVTPAAGARHADGSTPVLVQFSAPLAAGSPEPVIKPAVAGTWSHVGNDASFTPARPFRPGSRFTVEIPGGSRGVRTAAGAALATSMTAHFATRGYSQLRLSELLSQLGYLPLTWSPRQGGAIRSEEQDAGYVARGQASLAYDPPAGSFTWQPGYPSVLASMWQPGRASVVLRGAVMAFQSEHGMAIDGTLSPKLWSALFRAARKGDRNGNGYTYALASKSLPESLTIWHDGRVVMRTLANTGIPVAPTVDGTFPVYERFRFQIMQGTNPDGSTYADPVSYVSYFNGGDAVHYFPRGSYGSQQSLGCVELPMGSAAQAYPYLTYGSLVTVAG
jgi:peptidoglycan hydrolase-like protein with peptidoglycan-binding domain